jgi:hypothetical protein
MPSLSGHGLDPDGDVFTVPNVPLWTGLNSLGSGLREAKRWFMLGQGGRNTPFVNVTVNGLLWGYEDAMPCLKVKLPERCRDQSGVTSPVAGWDDEEDWGNDGWIADWEHEAGLKTEEQLLAEEDLDSPYYGLAK